MILYRRRWDEIALIYGLYLMLELYPFLTIQRKVNSGYKYLVLVLYPIFGLGNAALRALAWFVWAYKRFVTGEMRRKTEKDRKWNATALLAALLCGAAIGSTRAATPPTREDSRAKPATPAPAAPLGKMIVQWDHIIDSNNTFEDFWGYLSYKQTHYQAWYGDFTKGGEIGGFLRDHRRSTWSAFYRYRKDFDQVVEIDTEQILKRGFVAAVLLRGIHVIPDNAPDAQDQLQYGGGLDYYWGDYDFLSFRAISDPRQGGRWSFIASTRLYRGEPIYVQPGIVKHTDGSTGWFVQGKIKLFRWSAGKYNQFDWTEVDRTIYSAGLEWTY